MSHAVRTAGVKVALLGLGGDELFGAYPSFAQLGKLKRHLRLWGNVPAALRISVGQTAQFLRGPSIAAAKTSALLASDGHLVTVYPLIRQVLSPAQRDSLLTDQFLQRGLGDADPYQALLHAAFDGSADGFMS